MCIRLCYLTLALVTATATAAAGCDGSDSTRVVETKPPPDLAASVEADLGGAVPLPESGDMAKPPAHDDTPDAGYMPSDGFVGTLPDGGVYNPDGGGGPVDLGPPGTMSGIVVLGGGTDFRDVSSDQGGGTWAVTSGAAYYWPKGSTAAYTYNQGSGLARGRYTWHDDYWCQGSTPCPTDSPVSFSAVSGGHAGQAIVGNIGYIADRLEVDPASGAVQLVEGFQVTSAQQPNPTELMEQQRRVVATWRAIVDLAGTYNGSAYIGGFHGTSAIHGLNGTCFCLDFEEHVHPFFDGNTQTAGGDVRAYSLTPAGDVWVGDRDVVGLYLARSRGPTANLDQTWAAALDVFPGVKDEVWGLGADAQGGVWVASYGHGAAYLAPGSYAPTYYSAADKLPSNYLTGAAVDRNGDVWLGTFNNGVVRYTPSVNAWTYYTTASGLPSSYIRAVYVDPYASTGRAVYFATANGVAIYTGP